jgi:tRNA pseudouridine13 synthase
MYPFLTKELQGIGGVIRYTPEDFQVTEIPAYPCTGTGEHIFLYVEKKDLYTLEVVNSLATQLKISPHDVGYAGQKDCHALTRQYFSVPQSALPYIEKINLPGVQILSIQRHQNKLRIGHLHGNIFHILIRDYNKDQIPNLSLIKEQLLEKGVPNYFGEQRFGSQNNTHIIGKAILQNNGHDLLEAMFAPAPTIDSERIAKAKEYYIHKEYDLAYKEMPAKFKTEKLLLKKLASGVPEKNIISMIPKQMHTFFICAYQSWLFNEILTSRLDHLDSIETGDLAVKHPGRTVFLVEDSNIEQQRCKLHEISASGPIYGRKMIQPQGKPLEREMELLQKENITKEMFPLDGERRSLRFFLQDLSWEIVPEGIWINFTLPKSCYATVVLRELMKYSQSQNFGFENAQFD